MADLGDGDIPHVPAAGYGDNPSRPAPDSSFPALPRSTAPFPTHFDSAKQLTGPIPEGVRALSRWHHPACGLWWPAQVPRAEGVSPRDALISGRCTGFRGNPCSHWCSCGQSQPRLPLGRDLLCPAHSQGWWQQEPPVPIPQRAPNPRQRWQGSPWPNASQLLAEGNVPSAGGGFLVAAEGQDNKTGKN